MAHPRHIPFWRSASASLCPWVHCPACASSVLLGGLRLACFPQNSRPQPLHSVLAREPQAPVRSFGTGSSQRSAQFPADCCAFSVAFVVVASAVSVCAVARASSHGAPVVGVLCSAGPAAVALSGQGSPPRGRSGSVVVSSSPFAGSGAVGGPVTKCSSSSSRSGAGGAPLPLRAPVLVPVPSSLLACGCIFFVRLHGHTPPLTPSVLHLPGVLRLPAVIILFLHGGPSWDSRCRGQCGGDEGACVPWLWLLSSGWAPPPLLLRAAIAHRSQVRGGAPAAALGCSPSPG